MYFTIAAPSAATSTPKPIAHEIKGPARLSHEPFEVIFYPRSSRTTVAPPGPRDMYGAPVGDKQKYCKFSTGDEHELESVTRDTRDQRGSIRWPITDRFVFGNRRRLISCIGAAVRPRRSHIDHMADKLLAEADQQLEQIREGK